MKASTDEISRSLRHAFVLDKAGKLAYDPYMHSGSGKGPPHQLRWYLTCLAVGNVFTSAARALVLSHAQPSLLTFSHFRLLIATQIIMYYFASAGPSHLWLE